MMLIVNQSNDYIYITIPYRGKSTVSIFCLVEFLAHIMFQVMRMTAVGVVSSRSKLLFCLFVDTKHSLFQIMAQLGMLVPAKSAK